MLRLRISGHEECALWRRVTPIRRLWDRDDGVFAFNVTACSSFGRKRGRGLLGYMARAVVSAGGWRGDASTLEVTLVLPEVRGMTFLLLRGGGDADERLKEIKEKRLSVLEPEAEVNAARRSPFHYSALQCCDWGCQRRAESSTRAGGLTALQDAGQQHHGWPCKWVRQGCAL